MSFVYDVNAVRKDFPACCRTKNGYSVGYLDGPGGTQVPLRVVKAMENYLLNHNANEGGAFDASYETADLYMDAKEAAAVFLNAKPSEIGFGLSSSKNNFELAFAIGKTIKPGDEVLITDLDHLCNRAPWLMLAEKGAVVKSVKVDVEKQIIDMEDFKSKLSDKTKVAAFTWASNALGTVPDVKEMCRLARERGAISVVDGVHYAAHFAMDVKDIGADVVLCSAYKFFGPHMGIIYIREPLTHMLEFYNVGAADLKEGISKFQFGTPQFEAICGAAEAIKYIENMGETYAPQLTGEIQGLTGRRRNIVAAFAAFEHHEEPLARYMREEFRNTPGVKVYGPAEGVPRTSTVIITVEGHNPRDVCVKLNDMGIYAWAGSFYATQVIDVAMGLKEKGGVIRFGISPYNTEEEVRRAIDVVQKLK